MIDTRTPRPYDCIVVLGGGISRKGEISEFTKQRVAGFVGLLGSAAITPDTQVAMSGKWGITLSYRPPRTEAAGALAFAHDLVNKTPLRAALARLNIYTEEDAMDTIGNAYFTTVKFLRPQQVSKLLVVTSDFHAPRTTKIFRWMLGPEVGISVLGVPSGLDADAWEAKVEQENALWEFAETSLFGDATPGDLSAVPAILDLLPGYNKIDPSYSVEELEERFSLFSGSQS